MVLAWHWEVPVGVTAKSVGQGNKTATASPSCIGFFHTRKGIFSPKPPAQGGGLQGVGAACDGKQWVKISSGTSGGLGSALGLTSNGNKVLFLPK